MTRTDQIPREVLTALRRAVDYCEDYARFIRHSVNANDLECHPYLPALEQVVEDGRAALGDHMTEGQEQANQDAGR